jgi:hypothetical protein
MTKQQKTIAAWLDSHAIATSDKVFESLVALVERERADEREQCAIGRPDLIPCWCCGQAKKPSDMEMVKTTEYDNDGESIYRAVLICKHSDPEDNPCVARIRADEDKEQAARAALALALPVLHLASDMDQVLGSTACKKARAARDAVAALVGEKEGKDATTR